MSVLDDLKYIHERDSKDALGVAQKQWQQYQHNFEFEVKTKDPIKQVVMAGMGGSGLAAKALHSWPGCSVPLEIVQDYSLPPYVDESTLLVCISYSGNTEEILSVLSSALKLKSTPQIVIVASGGQLLEMAKQNHLFSILLPAGYSQRATFGYQLKALCQLLEACGLASDLSPKLNLASNWLSSEIESWLPTKPTNHNLAKQLALDLLGKSVVVYAGPKLAPAAYKWKINVNENAKQIAWFNQYPEFNHNEFIGWSAQPIDKPYAVVELRSILEGSRINERFVISERLLSGRRPAPMVVDVQGDTILKQLMWAIALGDFTTLYLALLNKIDPTPVDLIERLKQDLKNNQ